MKMKALSFLPGALMLMLAASPMLPSFTHAANAQTPNRGGREMKADQLGLTDTQKAQLKQIRESTRQQVDALLTTEQKEQLRVAKQQRQRPKLTLTEEQKTKMKAIRQAAKAQMDAVYTPEQKQKLQELHQQWQQRRQQRQSQPSS